MRIVRKTILMILAMLPIASVSTVAYSQLNEMAGEGQTDLLRSKIALARRLLFPNGVLITSNQEAKERLSRQTGITDEYLLDEEFNRQVETLLENGLVEVNETFMRAATPSAW